MKRLLFMLAVVAICTPAFVNAQQKNSTEAVVHAANDFLATLSAEQKQKVIYAFDDATQRARWSNFPTGFVARGGISLKQMTVPQQRAAMELLGTVLSPMGLEKVNEIRQADDGTGWKAVPHATMLACPTATAAADDPEFAIAQDTFVLAHNERFRSTQVSSTRPLILSTK